jgi:hypothetical protein
MNIPGTKIKCTKCPFTEIVTKGIQRYRNVDYPVPTKFSQPTVAFTLLNMSTVPVGTAALVTKLIQSDHSCRVDH